MFARRASLHFFAVGALLALAPSAAIASAPPPDLSLGDGIPWSNSGFIANGSGYDLRSGRMSRAVTDFVVTGSVGESPLIQQRAVYTEANEGGVYTKWVMHAYAYRTNNYYVWTPSGTRIYFDVPTSDGVTTLRNKGGSDRVTKTEAESSPTTGRPTGRTSYSTPPGNRPRSTIGTALPPP